ncbi:MAG TPA: proprotein convertase P-domain-containing protein [Bacillaceae bacterium]
MANGFRDTVTAIEMQLAEALRIVTENGDLDQIERIAELLILKEKLLEELLGELCQPETTTFENSASIIIDGDEQGPAQPYPSVIAVSGMQGAVRNVTVTLYGLTHTFPGDLDILLVGPQGQNVMLMSDSGGSLDVNNVTLEFDDAAADFLPNGSQIVSGTYKPTNYEADANLPAPAPPQPYGAALSVFDSTNPNGNWRLFVFDDFIGDRGQIADGWDLTITTNPCVTATGQVVTDGIDSTIFDLESELSRAFQVILDAGNPDQIERFLKLLINKELLLLLIRDEIVNGNGNGNGGEGDCPCKFRIGIQGREAPADVLVIREGQPNLNLSGTINVSAEQCFTGARQCNPSVDQFNVNFGTGQGGTTINFTPGARTRISCTDGIQAVLEGRANASGNLLSGDFNLRIVFTINPVTEQGTWNITATSFDGDTVFQTTFTAPISSRTFIGDCSENVGPN